MTKKLLLPIIAAIALGYSSQASANTQQPQYIYVLQPYYVGVDISQAQGNYPNPVKTNAAETLPQTNNSDELQWY